MSAFQGLEGVGLRFGLGLEPFLEAGTQRFRWT